MEKWRWRWEWITHFSHTFHSVIIYDTAFIIIVSLIIVLIIVSHTILSIAIAKHCAIKQTSNSIWAFSRLLLLLFIYCYCCPVVYKLSFSLPQSNSHSVGKLQLLCEKTTITTTMTMILMMIKNDDKEGWWSNPLRHLTQWVNLSETTNCVMEWE